MCLVHTLGAGSSSLEEFVFVYSISTDRLYRKREVLTYWKLMTILKSISIPLILCKARISKSLKIAKEKSQYLTGLLYQGKPVFESVKSVVLVNGTNQPDK